MFSLAYVYVLIAVISLSNVLVIVYKSQTGDVDAFLICNLAIGSITTIVPLLLFIFWHFRYENKLMLYEQFLSNDPWCDTAGVIVMSSTQLSSAFSLFIALLRYYGIVKSRPVAFLKTRIYMAIAACWCATYGLCFAIRIGYSKSMPHDMLTDCFFNPDYGYRSHLLVLGIITTVCTIGSMLFHALILMHSLRSRSIQVGRRHGTTVYTSSIIRLTAAIMWAALCLLPAGVLMICFFADVGFTESSQITVVLVVYVFSSHSATSPFIFTLCTVRIWNEVRKRLTL